MVVAAGADRQWDAHVHGATFEPIDRWTDILVRLGRRSLETRVEAHLRPLKERAERAGLIAGRVTRGL